MRKELFETGKSVDTAIESACEKLGCSREDCEWEIIDLPKKGFLGLKTIPAKVRVSIEIPDEKPAISPKPPKPLQSENKPQQISRPHPQKPAKQFQTETLEKVKHEKQETSPRTHKKAEPLKPEEISEKEALAKNYLAEVLDAAGLKAEYTVVREHGGSCINIIGEGLGMIIGRRGETLDAIQYLAGLVANRGEGDYLRLTVDCGEYRSKRKSTLESLARKLASQVLKTDVSRTLEPMNPFERRIIHATVSEIEGVSSSSIGEEPNRRVIITSPAAKPPAKGAFRGDRDSSRPSYGRSRGPRRDFDSPANTARSGERAERSESGERGGYNRDNHRDNRTGRDGRDGRRSGGASRQAQSAPQGPPKQTPESEVTAGISFGKIEL